MTILKEKFKILQKSQRKIASDLGVNFKTFSNHLNGTRNVPPKTALLYIEYLNKHGVEITLEDIYFYPPMAVK